MNTIAQIQTILNDAGFPVGKIDGLWGPKSQTALDEAVEAGKSRFIPPETLGAVHSVKASSFADPADVRAFRRCKAQGRTDNDCFSVGDNGVGKWGDDTTAPLPMCALPPEDWEMFGASARGKKVLVKANGLSIVCELRDTMPHKKHIKNGAGIDLNEAAITDLGLSVPIMVPATWQYV